MELNDEILIAMYIETDRIIYSPSDLTLYMDSPFASWMEHSVLINPELLSSADAPDEFITKKRALHEDEVLKSFLEANLSVIQILKNPNAAQDTLAAMQLGVEIIYQAALSLLPFKGYADFLVKAEGGSRLFDFYYGVCHKIYISTLHNQENYLLHLYKTALLLVELFLLTFFA
jgi:hypothetical protein